MTREQLVSALVKRCSKSSQSAVSRELGVSATYLGEVLKGKKAPSAKILNALGMERVVYYRVKQKSLTALAD